jgi:excisionase family DNA binding protein
MRLMTHSPVIDPSQTMPDLAEFMTTKEAAVKLGFHVKRIPTMVRNNTLEGIRFGRVWLVSKKSIQEYIDKTQGMSKNDPRRKTQE